MTQLVRLLPNQKKTTPVEPPFPTGSKVHPDQLEMLVIRMLEGSDHARERLILGNTYLVLNLVGRYLRYWPATRRFEDDMVSEGVAALIMAVDNVKQIQDFEWLVYKIIVKVKYAIEVFVNDNQSIVSASFGTNRRKSAENQPLEYCNAEPVTDRNSYTEDQASFYVDLADSIEHLIQSDNEEMIDAVINFLESKHQIKHSDLSADQLSLAFELIKITKGEI